MPRMWKILTIPRTTDEAEVDLRRLCANKLRGPYLITNERAAGIQVAVIMDKDMDAVLNFADVHDRTIHEFFHNRDGAHMAETAWDDYIKSLSRN